MSSKRHGNRIVSDLSKAILYLFSTKGRISSDDVVSNLRDRYDDAVIRKRIQSLKYHGSITGPARQKLSITAKGIEALANLEFEKLPAVKKWDHRWRLVIYDIPETKRMARDQIRFLLKSLGFQRLQISVWAHPMPCLKQFRDIQKAYGVEHHLLILEAKDSADFSLLKKSFAKQYPIIKARYIPRS